MIFERPFQVMPNGCVAVVSKKKSCLMQPGPITHKRPLVKHDGEQWKASRLSYHLNKGSIPRTPKGKSGRVLHTCDHEWCINPEHLYLGTVAQNNKDFFERSETVHENMRKGAARAWSRPERRMKQSASLKGNQNVKGKTWKWRKKCAI